MPHRIEDGAAARANTAASLQHLWKLAQHAAQRPGNCGGPLKVLEMLMGRADFRPRDGGRA